jgi:hypothetical protein
VAGVINILLLYMMPLEWSMRGATIWRITIELSITILEASFKLIYDVYRTGITYEELKIIN